MQLYEQNDLDVDSDGEPNSVVRNGKNGANILETEAKLRNHRLTPTCLCIDSKDNYAFTASKDGSIIKWDLSKMSVLRKVNSITKREAEAIPEAAERRHVNHINAIAISSDDKFLATGGWDKRIRIWSPENLDWIHTFTLHRKEITTLAFRRDHHTLYSGSVDKSVMLWTLEDDENRCFVDTLIGHESAITSMDTSRKERVLTAGGLDQSIRVWKIVEGAQTVFQSKHGSADVAKYIDDKTFVSGGEDGNITLWTTMKRSSLCTVKAHGVDEKTKLSCWVSSLATYPLKQIKQSKKDRPGKKRKLDDGSSLRVDSGDENTDDESSEEEDENGHQVEETDRPYALVASGSCDSKLNIWKIVKNNLLLHQSFECPGFINDLKFTNNGRKLVAITGKEHRFGRWTVQRGSKNTVKIFELSDITD